MRKYFKILIPAPIFEFIDKGPVGIAGVSGIIGCTGTQGSSFIFI